MKSEIEGASGLRGKACLKAMQVAITIGPVPDEKSELKGRMALSIREQNDEARATKVSR